MTEPSQPAVDTTMSDLQLAFRQSFLWRLSNPGAADTVCAFGDLLFDLLNEAHEWGPDPGADSLRAELCAVTVDLEHVTQTLEGLSQELNRAHGSDENNELADRVSGWVGRLSLVLLDMQRRPACRDEEPKKPKP